MRFVTDNSGISSKDFRRLMMNTGELVMDVGTVLDGEKAVQAGADRPFRRTERSHLLPVPDD